MSIKGKLQDWLLTAKTGVITKTIDKPIEELVIRYKDLYFCVDIDVESGEPTGDFTWAHDSNMFHVPVRDMYVARKPR